MGQDGNGDQPSANSGDGGSASVEPEHKAPDGKTQQTGADAGKHTTGNITDKQMVAWTRAIAFLTFVLALAAVAGNVIIYWQLQEMGRSYEIAKLALLGVERPYLIAQVSKQKIITGKLPPEVERLSGLMSTDIILTVSNGGRQPALIDKFDVIFRHDIESADRVNPRELLKDVVEDGKVKPSWVASITSNDATCDDVPTATYIPSGASITVKCGGLLYLHEARALLTNRRQIFLMGGINYRSPIGARWQVGFTMRYEPPRLDDEKDAGHFEVVTDPRLTYDVIVEDKPPE